jgi:hypothetical protein
VKSNELKKITKKIIKNFKNSKNSQMFYFRESTEEGAPLAEVIQTGLDRPRFSADCLNVLMKELKLNAQDGWNKHPIIVLIDGINGLFEERTGVSKILPRRMPSKRISQEYISSSCTPDELSLIVSLKHMLKYVYTISFRNHLGRNRLSETDLRNCLNKTALANPANLP